MRLRGGWTKNKEITHFEVQMYLLNGYFYVNIRHINFTDLLVLRYICVVSITSIFCFFWRLSFLYLLFFGLSKPIEAFQQCINVFNVVLGWFGPQPGRLQPVCSVCSLSLVTLDAVMMCHFSAASEWQKATNWVTEHLFNKQALAWWSGCI